MVSEILTVQPGRLLARTSVSELLKNEEGLYRMAAASTRAILKNGSAFTGAAQQQSKLLKTTWPLR